MLLIPFCKEMLTIDLVSVAFPCNAGIKISIPTVSEHFDISRFVPKTVFLSSCGLIWPLLNAIACNLVIA